MPHEKRRHPVLALGHGSSQSTLTVHKKPNRVEAFPSDLEPPIHYPVRRYLKTGVMVDGKFVPDELPPRYQRGLLWQSKFFDCQWKRERFLQRLVRKGGIIDSKKRALRQRRGAKKRFELLWKVRV